jgi:hypothetical protein
MSFILSKYTFHEYNTTLVGLFYKSYEKLSYQNTAKIKLKFQTNEGLGFRIAIYFNWIFT